MNHQANTSDITSEILAGPMLRRVQRNRMVIWFASRAPITTRLVLHLGNQEGNNAPAPLILNGAEHTTSVQVGTSCFIHLLDMPLSSELPLNQHISYDLQWSYQSTDSWFGIAQWAPHLTHQGQALPRFVLRQQLQNLLHGSCRKPHHAADDGLVAADSWLEKRKDDVEEWPAALMMTGDQVYVDDVAGPMLTAIHQLVDELGLYHEELEGARVKDSRELLQSSYNYYHRNDLLPDTRMNQSLRSRFFEGARKPIFTTTNADNHLITLAEVVAMYLLVWSPVPWRGLSEGDPAGLSEQEQQRYRKERERLIRFIEGLPKVQRLFAHVPTLMIFDDHDITDDWNLTADWEQTAYQHPFSRRIIGNALVGYFLCQGWGNNPDAFKGNTLEHMQSWSKQPTSSTQDALINHLLRLQKWHYSLPTEPKLIVLDTRTRRWRSERNLNHPSGLMDWEALSELQSELLEHKAAIIVSPTPVFGVKLIEGIQKLFTWAGRPLMVDAENWMAHRGTAYTMLNILRHTHTPAHYVVLSGDVHYSFVYGVRIRSKRGNPHLWQVTSSGIKNQFPEKLLDTLDRLNRWLYSPRSPLNWLTKRRRLEIQPFKPCSASKGERLLNQPGIGHVRFSADGKPLLVEQISADTITRFNVVHDEQDTTVPDAQTRAVG